MVESLGPAKVGDQQGWAGGRRGRRNVKAVGGVVAVLSGSKPFGQRCRRVGAARNAAQPEICWDLPGPDWTTDDRIVVVTALPWLDHRRPKISAPTRAKPTPTAALQPYRSAIVSRARRGT